MPSRHFIRIHPDRYSACQDQSHQHRFVYISGCQDLILRTQYGKQHGFIAAGASVYQKMTAVRPPEIRRQRLRFRNDPGCGMQIIQSFRLGQIRSKNLFSEKRRQCFVHSFSETMRRDPEISRIAGCKLTQGVYQRRLILLCFIHTVISCTHPSGPSRRPS